MTRWEAWFNHVALAAISVSGVAYGIFKYFVPGSDPDSRIGHPWQPVLLKTHILVAPAVVFGMGLLFRHHAIARMRARGGKRRYTGALMLWLVLPLTLTGYLVQVFVESPAVRAAGWSHAALGLWFLLGYVLHPKRKASAGAVGDDASGEGGQEGARPLNFRAGREPGADCDGAEARSDCVPARSTCTSDDESVLPGGDLASNDRNAPEDGRIAYDRASRGE